MVFSRSPILSIPKRNLIGFLALPAAILSSRPLDVAGRTGFPLHTHVHAMRSSSSYCMCESVVSQMMFQVTVDLRKRLVMFQFHGVYAPFYLWTCTFHRRESDNPAIRRFPSEVAVSWTSQTALACFCRYPTRVSLICSDSPQ